MTRLLSLALLLMLLPVPSHAADLRVTDTHGSHVLVRGVSIDYPAGIAAVREKDGIRVRQGDATVTVKWSDLESLTMVGRDKLPRPDRLDVEIVMRGGRRLTATIVRANETKVRGTSDLGDYAIDLDRVRSIEAVDER